MQSEKTNAEGMLEAAKVLIQAGTLDDAIFQLKQCIELLEKEKQKLESTTDANASMDMKKPAKPILPSA